MDKRRDTDHPEVTAIQEIDGQTIEINERAEHESTQLDCIEDNITDIKRYILEIRQCDDQDERVRMRVPLGKKVYKLRSLVEELIQI